MSILSGLLGSGADWAIIRGRQLRRDFADAVWALYQQVYAPLGGLNVGSRDSLFEYDEWHLYLTPTGEVRAFGLARSADPYGMKLGALGSDGSVQAKDALKDYFRNITKHGGYWAETSGATLALARKLNLPVICPSYAPRLLQGKALLPGDKPGSYKRNIKGVGLVEKVLVGSPPGIPTVRSEGQCGLPARLGGLGQIRRVRERPDPLDLIEHYSAEHL